MATEEIKKQNQIRLSNMTLLSLAAGTWNTLGESSFAFSGPMGETILKTMEHEMGLEIEGEDPQQVMMEISRIFVDEFGFASDIDVVQEGDGVYKLKVKNCINRGLTDKLVEAGVEKPFICPIMNAATAALRRMGYRLRENVEKWEDGKGSIITFTEV